MVSAPDPVQVGASTLESPVVVHFGGDRASGFRGAARSERNSLTLALPFGETPLDSQAGREFLQRRLALFSAVAATLGGFALFAGQLVESALPHYHFPSSFLGNGGWFQLLAIGVSLAVWAAARRGNMSLRALLVLDVLGTLLMLSAYAKMASMSGHRVPQRVDLMMMLITLCVVMLRAVVIPSPWPHTLVIGAIGSIPALELARQNAAAVVIEGSPTPPWAAMGYMGVWIAVALAISVVTSRVIYGLRCQVAQVERLGQYVLEEKIGEGGMGVVYRARHALLRRPTAIKLVLPERAGPDNLARFEREVQLTASLTHPNTVSVYDYGSTPEGVFYYAMEYLDGVDLEQLVMRFGPQSPARVAHILSQVAASLGEAHSIGLVHRDIKPGNIILCERGGVADTAKVVDFGLVKSVSSLGREGQGPTLSSANTIVGTPLYLAPEGLTSPDRIDARADLYALGAVGYYLLTGAPVFRGQSLLEVAAQHLHQAPVPPSERVEQPIPRALEALIMRCLAKNPLERPQSANELISELKSCGVSEWTLSDAGGWWQENGATARARMRSRSDGKGPGTVVIDLARRVAPA
ncbi:MAG TPA: serine/threonine-protein kinase [Polyangiaceae bacterium]|nr:serine/threonine-protein kinase [Polyangiaceae bacterium]